MKRVLLTMIALSSFMTIASGGGGGGGGAKPLELKSREELIGGWKD